ncbi:DNA repair protein [Flavobacterium tructae]|uniref:JAB domain-containing protein n=1 Tax=Flavobacterium tructae TaxID=1114873 RepID=UPI000B5C041D|nr:JAB domain-containing protein [Flavobacterium tructae]OXB25309.1 DNA repair protein [Flavobacterium tructae]
MRARKEKQDWKIASEIELIYKNKVRVSERPYLSSSKTAYELALKVWDMGKIEFFEQCKVFLLNRSNKVLGVYEVSSGGTSGISVDLKLLFASVIKANASAFIMIHNHPSGKTLPSIADRLFTKKVNEAVALLDIKLVDHLIITLEGYYSFADNGNFFEDGF